MNNLSFASFDFCCYSFSRSALVALFAASDGKVESAVPADSCMEFKAVPGSPLEKNYEIIRSGSTVTGIKFTSANTLTAQTVTLQIQFYLLTTTQVTTSSAFFIELTIAEA